MTGIGDIFQLHTLLAGTLVGGRHVPGEAPSVDGVRLLVLAPLAYRQSRPSGRFFPGMRGDLTLERVLDAAETADWFGKVTPAAG
ncbi:hypothetical protein [Streptomyces sp. UNOC14_S4]|uniref:hypothetical protein n=1 Tax=Streptomyces sp. UNOC14_S4 TaxID=2872340 RepID=UPI001E5ABDF4|nr:hypothetical protein [Streptomyces sp. UNOC14_S4]MCC3773093.1 hypothetical protein [Streptomyces sp. UNOC14_S4]